MSNLVFKILVLGEPQIGKTTAIQRLVKQRYIPRIKTTIGMDYSIKHLVWNIENSNEEIDITLQIWDIAGETKFREIVPFYLQGLKGLILAFDDSLLDTLQALYGWLEFLGSHINLANIPMVLMSTKDDITTNKNLSEISSFLKDLKISNYFATSSRTGKNINNAFEKLTQLVIRANNYIPLVH